MGARAGPVDIIIIIISLLATFVARARPPDGGGETANNNHNDNYAGRRVYGDPECPEIRIVPIPRELVEIWTSRTSPFGRAYPVAYTIVTDPARVRLPYYCYYWYCYCYRRRSSGRFEHISTIRVWRCRRPRECSVSVLLYSIGFFFSLSTRLLGRLRDDVFLDFRL